MKESHQIIASNIQNLIYSIRGQLVMLDSDIAEMYGVETKQVNRAVSRNKERFPEKFRFQLNKTEWDDLRYQIGTLKKSRGAHRKYLPYVFNEQGVAMLSAVLRSPQAVKVSVGIMDAFVNMRKFIATNAQVLHRLDKIEVNQLKQGDDIEKLFSAMEEREIVPKQSVIFKGDFFDAYVFVTKIIKSAKSSILLIDNYIDESVLELLSQRRKNVKIKIITTSNSKVLNLAIEKFRQQYGELEVERRDDIHDRYFIIDDGKSIYHFGHSIKDLGKKLSGFSKFEKDGLELLKEIN